MLRGIWVISLLVVSTFVLGGMTLVALPFPFRMRVYWWAGRLWSSIMVGATGAPVTIEGGSNLDVGRDYFFVGNHESAIDIPLMVLAACRPVRFLAKDTLFKIPLFGWVLRAYKETPIDRSSPRKVKESIRRLMEYQKETPRSLVIFPEGTRGDGTDILPFKVGVGKILVQLGLPVVPFSIRGSFAVHEARTIRVHAAPVRIILGAPIPAEEVREADPAALIARVEEVVAEQYHRGLTGGETGVGACSLQT